MVGVAAHGVEQVLGSDKPQKAFRVGGFSCDSQISLGVGPRYFDHHVFDLPRRYRKVVFVAVAKAVSGFVFDNKAVDMAWGGFWRDGAGEGKGFCGVFGVRAGKR